MFGGSTGEEESTSLISGMKPCQIVLPISGVCEGLAQKTAAALERQGERTGYQH